MALLDSTPALVDDHSERVYRWIGISGDRQYRDDQVRIYEWPCDDTGGETTHEAVYGTGGFELTWYGRLIPYGKTSGVWREIYRKVGSWTDA